MITSLDYVVKTNLVSLEVKFNSIGKCIPNINGFVLFMKNVQSQETLILNHVKVVFVTILGNLKIECK